VGACSKTALHATVSWRRAWGLVLLCDCSALVCDFVHACINGGYPKELLGASVQPCRDSHFAGDLSDIPDKHHEQRVCVSQQEQLHAQLYQPILIRHPMLKALAACHEQTLTTICDMAMSQASLGSAEELFAYGKETEHMYFVVRGCLLYFEGPSPSPGIPEEVFAGDWFCDHALWVRWIHRGQMTGLEPCELAKLDCSSFRNVVGQRTMVHTMCSRFAECYLAAITDDLLEGCCNDLCCSTEKLDNILSMVATPSF